MSEEKAPAKPKKATSTTTKKATSAAKKTASTTPKKATPAKPHKGTENLVPIQERSEDEQREICRKGGIESGRVRREKKLLREKLEFAMSMPMRAGKVASLEDVKSFEDAKGLNLTLEDWMLMQIARKGANGDLTIYQLYRDELGQKLPDRLIVSGEVDVTSASLDDLLKMALDMQKKKTK